MIALINTLYDKHILTRLELKTLIEHVLKDEVSRQHLFKQSLKTKRKHYGDTVFMRGLIEISNYCNRTCQYCGISIQNTDVERYRLDKEMILACCKEGYDLGFRTFVMQGGEDSYFDDDVIVDLVQTIKKMYPECAITLSLGEKNEASYQRLKEAGVDRYLLRHETATQNIYEAMHPKMSFERRRNCLKSIKKVGMQTGAGFLVGLPNQKSQDYVDDLLFLKELKPEMVGIGPFIPHDKTPLGNQPAGDVTTVLVMLALTRLLLPKVLLPSTTALGTLDSTGREKALALGANVVMPNLSPNNVKSKYEIYQNKVFSGLEAAQSRDGLANRIESTGFKVEMGRGDHVDWR